MRILISGIDWPPETFLDGLITGLARAGTDITIACHNKPNRDWRNRHGIKWLFTPTWNASVVIRILRLCSMILKAVFFTPRTLVFLCHKVSKAHTFVELAQSWYRLLPFLGKSWDVLYFPWNSAAMTYASLFDLGFPAIVSCRGSQINIDPHNPKNPGFQADLKMTFSRSEAVHCVSHAILKEAIQFGLDPLKAIVIHPAVDPDFFYPPPSAGLPMGPLRVVTTGMLTWVKGYEYALLALRELLDANVPAFFDVIGDGPERQRILFTIQDLGLERHVCLHGTLKPEKVREQLWLAHVFVLSSLSEGVSNAALEAMSCHLPLITTDCGGMREVVTDGIEGFVVPPRDPKAMASALRKLYLDPTLGKRMGLAARAKVLEQFSLKHQIDSFLSLYRSVMDKGNRGAHRNCGSGSIST